MASSETAERRRRASMSDWRSAAASARRSLQVHLPLPVPWILKTGDLLGTPGLLASRTSAMRMVSLDMAEFVEWSSQILTPIRHDGTNLMMFVYANEPDLSVEDFVDVLRRSTLADRRPLKDAERVARMLHHADLIVTARNPAGTLVGVSRAITDFSYCTYLSDLAVDQEFQRRGIGRQLVVETHQRAGLETSLILLSAPQAESYYPHIGMEKHNSCWRFPARGSGDS